MIAPHEVVIVGGESAGCALAARLNGLGVVDGSTPADSMACAAHSELLGKASTSATLDEDGGVTVCSAACDLGHGTNFIMTQIAADRLRLPTDRVRVHLGSSSRPAAASPGESRTVPMLGAAIDEACVALMSAIARRASDDMASPFFAMPLERLRAEAGRITQDGFEDRAESWSDLAARWDGDPVAVALIHSPTPGQ